MFELGYKQTHTFSEDWKLNNNGLGILWASACSVEKKVSCPV